MDQNQKKKKVSKIGRITIPYYFNIPGIICYHVVGKNHKLHHRRRAGGVVMVVGVVIAYVSHATGSLIIALPGDVIGYALHGAGLVPFLEEEEVDEEES